MRELTPKQRLFAAKVAAGASYAQAYREAYQSKGSPRTVGVEASKLANDPRIRAAIEKMIQQRNITEKPWETLLHQMRYHPDPKVQLKATIRLGRLAGLF